jgi:hypothetical protein
MNEIYYLLPMAIITGFAIGIGAIVLGFKMGRRTQGESTSIKEVTIESNHKEILADPDIFDTHINDGTEGDVNERIRTT